MSYSNSIGQSAAVEASPGRMLVAERDAGNSASEIINRLERLLSRLRVAPPTPVNGGLGTEPLVTANTFDRAQQHVAHTLARAHELLREVEELL